MKSGRRWLAIARVALLVLGGTLLALTLAARSFGDSRDHAAGLGFLYLVMAGLVLVGMYGIELISRWRTLRVAKSYPIGQAWRVQNGRLSYYLVVSPQEVLLVRNKFSFVWPRQQVRRVSDVSVRIGLRDRRALRIEFGAHKKHETFELLFPAWLGLRDDRTGLEQARRSLRTGAVT